MVKYSLPIPIYIGDYLCDTGDLSTLDHGIYLLLIMHYWENGSLPDNDRILATIAHVSLSEWEKRGRYLKNRMFEISNSSLTPRKVEAWRNWTFGRLPKAEWRKLVAQVIERDGSACWYCGIILPSMECDHVYPLSRGGTNELANLVMACRHHNRSKGSKMLSEWQL